MQSAEVQGDHSNSAADATRIRRSEQELDRLRGELGAWLGRQLPANAAPTILDIRGTSANGMSNETLLISAAWGPGAEQTTHQLVARVAPRPGDAAIFPRYDLSEQARVIRRVAQLTDVPVPEVLWDEADPSVIGSPFFVMRHVDGEIPADGRYLLGGFVFEADEAERRRLQDSMVGVLAGLHGVKGAEQEFSFLAPRSTGQSALRQHFAATWEWYQFARSGGQRSTVIEQTFAWLEANWPSSESSAVLNWGDARIGNVIYRDFVPVAVLDWEMTAIVPPEVDLGWLLYSHRVFVDLVGAGLPGFLEPPDVASHYERLTGREPLDLGFYLVYAALRWAIVLLRSSIRRVNSGELAATADVDDLVLNRGSLERMCAGSYWD
jgi:aminoglycoside phosphotransferase (APT) family kinase protein